MKKVSILLLSFLFASLQLLQAQNKEVSGTVTSSEDGQPIPGVAVIATGTNVGITTDIDGNYNLNLPTSATSLTFSFVGMADKVVEIGGQTVVNVVMDPSFVGLDEVVVTALGISREKKALGYAVQEVNADELNGDIQTDALSGLAGKVSGVQISTNTKMGGSSRILIRGANSITSENQPLIIVDGIAMDNSDFNNNSANGYGGDANGFGGYDMGNMMNDINPENIESISVLKGAAAAIYGSRAANGVIVITTKKAKLGQDGFSVEVNSNFGVEQIYMLPTLQRKYGGGVIIDDEDGGVNGFEQVNINGTDYLINQYQVDESWGPRYDPNIEVLHWDAFDQESYPDDYLNPRPWVAPENDVADFFDIGTSFTNNVAMSRSGSNYGVRFSYTNTNINGTMPGSRQDKNQFSLTGSSKMGSKLSIDAGLNYVNQYTKGRPQVGYGDNSVGQKFFQWGQRQLDYDRLRNYKNNDGTMRTWNRVGWDDPSPQYSDNAYWTAFENFNEDERDRFFGNVSLSYEIIDNLRLKGTVSGDTYAMYNRERTAIGSQASSKYYEAVRSNSEFNYEAILSYTKQFQSVTVDAFFGGNQRKTRYDFNRGYTSGGLVVPDVYNLLNSNDLAITADNTTEKQVNSLFGSVSVNLSELLTLEGTLRNDWSSTLPEDNNSYPYYSGSASFLFSELLENLTWLNLGKARFSYSKVGNDTDPYNVKSVYLYNGDGPFQGAPRLRASRALLNANLKPETTVQMEAGFDLAAVNNRINLAFTYFNNVTTDQIMPLDVSKATGYDTKWINAGKMTNTGFEFTLGLVPVATSDFQWEIVTNFTKVNNTLNELYGDLKALDISNPPFAGVFLRASLDRPYGQIWGHDFIYDDAGNKVVGGNGYWLQTPDLVPMGSILPDYNLGIRNAFTILNAIKVSALIDIQKGGKYYSVSHMWGMYSGMLEETAGVNDQGNEIRDPVSAGGGIKLDGVTGDVTFNDDGTYTVTNTAANEKYVSGSGWSARHYHGFGYPSAQSLFDADYIKLREVTIGYSLPASVIGPLKNVTVSLYGRNLAAFGLDWEGFDPELTVNGSGNVQGLDGGLYPGSRTFGVNLKLGF